MRTRRTVLWQSPSRGGHTEQLGVSCESECRLSRLRSSMSKGMPVGVHSVPFQSTYCVRQLTLLGPG